MLEKKQIWVIFLFKFRMSHKAAETTHNINQASGQELLRNGQGSSGSRRFAKEMRALKMRGIWGAPEADNDRLRAAVKADPLTATWEAAEEPNINHSMVVGHLKQIRKAKKAR